MLGPSVWVGQFSQLEAQISKKNGDSFSLPFSLSLELGDSSSLVFGYQNTRSPVFRLLTDISTPTSGFLGLQS